MNMQEIRQAAFEDEMQKIAFGISLSNWQNKKREMSDDMDRLEDLMAFEDKHGVSIPDEDQESIKSVDDLHKWLKNKKGK